MSRQGGNFTNHAGRKRANLFFLLFQITANNEIKQFKMGILLHNSKEITKYELYIYKI